MKDESDMDMSLSSLVAQYPFLRPAFNIKQEDKIDLVCALFQDLTVPQQSKVLRDLKDRFNRACQCNPLAILPRELLIDMLSHLDLPSVQELMMVSRDWYHICQDPQVWRSMFEAQGWLIDRLAMDQFLQSDEHDSLPMQPHPFSSSAVQPRPIERSLGPLVISASRSIPRPSPGRRPQSQKKKRMPAPSSSLHQDPLLSSSSRRIDWCYLYQQRHALAVAWQQGRYRPYRFRSDPDNAIDQPLSSSQAQRERDQHNDSVYSIVLDPVHHLVFTASRDHTVKEWKFDQGMATLQHTYTQLHHGSVLSLDISPRFLATASGDHTACLVDRWQRQLVTTFRGHGSSILNVALDDECLFTCSKDKSIKCWSLTTHQCLHTLLGHRESVNVIRLHGDHLLSGSGDHTLKLWDKRTGACLQTFIGHERSIASIDMIDNWIVSGSSDQSIIIWDKQGHILHKRFGHPGLVRTLQMQYHNNRLVLVSADYTEKINLWDVKTGTLLHTFPRYYPGRIMNIRFDNMKIVLGIDTGDVVVYDFAADIDTRFLL
ncbi:WD40 repeat-like protein [Hesseltinella vesiculosa]|uniref:WD40 repeat-like protein n=1 Tax=Hesseltinella vesiculosa TaxID=101127 RepID=A0A1X2GMR0_9FUNG|nr:WD40 repeat-like protein [Hesseltinella vesiculosa]